MHPNTKELATLKLTSLSDIHDDRAVAIQAGEIRQLASAVLELGQALATAEAELARVKPRREPVDPPTKA